MSLPFGVRITGNNWFNDGWVRGILGLPKAEWYDADNPVTDQDIDAFDDGYAMGQETPNEIREVFQDMIERGQLTIQ